MTSTEPSAVLPTDTETAPPAVDLSQFIRTYAKDVAQVSGKANVGALPRAKPIPEPEEQKPRGEVTEGVEFDATEQPFFEQIHKKEEDPYKPIDIESRAELDTFVETQPQGAPVSEAAQKRSEVMARLRAKMSEPLPQPVAPPAYIPPPLPPVFVAPPTAPVHAMPPVYREPITEVEERPVAVPLPRVQPTPPPTDTSGRFHSFSTDFKERAKDTGASAFSVLAADLDAGQIARAPAQSLRRRLPVLPLVLGVTLLVLASGGSYALYLYVGARTVLPAIVFTVPSLIFADEYRKIEGTGFSLMEALATTASESLASGTVLVTYIAQPATGEVGIIAGTPAPGGLLIQALSLPAPDLLRRNIEDASTVGVINEGGEARAFFVMRVSSFERTFAGMLTWEPLMSRDLALLYPLYPGDVPPSEQPVNLNTVATSTATVATSTATTTLAVATSTKATTKKISTPAPIAPPAIVPPVSVGRFEDAIVANRDVRILRDTRGRSLMLYGYADKETLIIARGEAAFAALLVRLTAGAK